MSQISVSEVKGPVGKLELNVEWPKDGCPKGVVVICHPHPPAGGSMNHKVVHYIARSVQKAGYVSVRFNFRGVGKSEGEYADGIGETEDFFAIMEFTQAMMKERDIDDLPILLAGFSFGTFVITNALVDDRMADYSIKKILLVAPPIPRWDFKDISAVESPITVFQGWHDELFSSDSVYEWAKPQSYTVTLFDTGHYFHGKLNELRDQTFQWLMAK